MWIDEKVAEALEHAVAIVAWKRERLRVQYPDKSRQAAFVRTLRPSLGIGSCEKK
jgi:hypothetical protein